MNVPEKLSHTCFAAPTLAVSVLQLAVQNAAHRPEKDCLISLKPAERAQPQSNDSSTVFITEVDSMLQMKCRLCPFQTMHLRA